jgi:hypothetical protein
LRRHQRVYCASSWTSLPLYGVACNVIPRREARGRAISASRVRALYKENDWRLMTDLLPASTLEHLRGYCGCTAGAEPQEPRACCGAPGPCRARTARILEATAAARGAPGGLAPAGASSGPCSRRRVSRRPQGVPVSSPYPYMTSKRGVRSGRACGQS